MAEILSKSNLFSSSSCSPHCFFISDCYKNSSSLKLQPLKSSSNCDFNGTRIILQQVERKPRRENLQSLPIKMSLCIGKAKRWWDKGLQSNVKEITSAQDLVESLLKSGDNLVILDFFSPICGGCKALHPKICQFAEMNPNVEFFQVNYEEHKSMGNSLNVHVLPFFRFYRGTHGHLCSFSCTNATIKKFKDALAKHTTERCSLGPPKGLDELEFLALAANKDLCFNYTAKPAAQLEPAPANLKIPLTLASKTIKDHEEKTLLVVGGR